MKRSHCTDLQLTPVKLATVAQQADRLGFEHRHLLGNGQQGTANGGQLDAPTAAVKQLDIEFAFQPLDLVGRGRLAEADGPGPGAEAGVPGHGKEGAQASG